MSDFTDTVKQDTPRLVVLFGRPAPDQEAYQWGIDGKVPILGLIGYITRVQTSLQTYGPWKDQLIEESALVIAWIDCKYVVDSDQPPKEFKWFVHPDIPVDSLVGMLDTIKVALITSQIAQQARNQQIALLGPDGQPMMRR